jgi:hypothetical protein
MIAPAFGLTVIATPHERTPYMVRSLSACFLRSLGRHHCDSRAHLLVFNHVWNDPYALIEEDFK